MESVRGHAGGTGGNAAQRMHSRRRRNNSARQEGTAEQFRPNAPLRTAPDVPWLTIGKRTFVDRAEDQYGNKDQWVRMRRPETRRELLGVMVDAIRETLEGIREAREEAYRVRRGARKRHNEFSGWVQAVDQDPAMFAEWLAEDASKQAGKEAAASLKRAATVPPPALTGASLEGADAPASTETGVPSSGSAGEYSIVNTEFRGTPFIDQMIREGRRHELEPELLDEVERAARRRQRRDENVPAASADAAESAQGPDVSAPLPMEVSDAAPAKPKRAVKGLKALTTTLRGHLQRTRTVFDKEGAYFYVNPHATKPRMARAQITPINLTVVKVDWPTIRAMRRGPRERRQRARERLMRLVRGEDPSTVPPLPL
jgi:hypothetical protein